MIEKFRFFLKFKTYNPQNFNIVDEKLQEIFPFSVNGHNKNTNGNPFLPAFGDRIESIQLTKGPIALPRKKKLFTVNRSNHVHKKSQEQFVQTTYNRFWILDLSLLQNAQDLAALQDQETSVTTLRSNVEMVTSLRDVSSRSDEKWKKLKICTSSFGSKGKDKKVIKTLFLPWFYAEADLLNIINFIKFSLEPLEKLSGLSMQWKAARSLKKKLQLFDDFTVGNITS